MSDARVFCRSTPLALLHAAVLFKLLKRKDMLPHYFTDLFFASNKSATDETGFEPLKRVAKETENNINRGGTHIDGTLSKT